MQSLVRLVYGAVMGLAVAAAPLYAADNPAWTASLPPFQITANLYYVGSRDLASYLVVTPAGNLLINANLQSSPPQIRASVESLGLRWQDTKILLNGQAHYDHVAGAAQILRETGAQNYVMEYDAEVMRSGGRTDFAFGSSDGLLPFPPTRVDRVLHDGDQVTLGGVTLTAHRTGGHTRGCTTWTMRAPLPKEPTGKLRDVVIVGGWAPLSQYRLVATPGQPASYPGIAEDFARTFGMLRGLPCDVFLGSHGLYFDMLQKRARMPTEGAKVWIDPQGYQAAVAQARDDFAQVLAAQQKAAVPPPTKGATRRPALPSP